MLGSQDIFNSALSIYHFIFVSKHPVFGNTRYRERKGLAWQTTGKVRW